jgi:hypothetical protein
VALGGTARPFLLLLLESDPRQVEQNILKAMTKHQVNWYTSIAFRLFPLIFSLYCYTVQVTLETNFTLASISTVNSSGGQSRALLSASWPARLVKGRFPVREFDHVSCSARTHRSVYVPGLHTPVSTKFSCPCLKLWEQILSVKDIWGIAL